MSLNNQSINYSPLVISAIEAASLNYPAVGHTTPHHTPRNVHMYGAYPATFVASGWCTMFYWMKIPPQLREATAKRIPSAAVRPLAPAPTHARPQATWTMTKRPPPQLPPRLEVDTLAVEEAPQARGSVYR